MRTFIMVPHAIFGNDCTEAPLEGVNRGGADATARDATSDDHRIDTLFDEEGDDGSLEEDGRSTLAYSDVVIRIIDAWVEFGRRIATDEVGADHAHLPVWHVARALVCGVADCHGKAALSGNLEQTARILYPAHNERGAPEWILRVGEGHLIIDDYNPGTFAEANVLCAIATCSVVALDSWSRHLASALNV